MSHPNDMANGLGKAMDRALGKPPGDDALRAQADFLEAYASTRRSGSLWVWGGVAAATTAACIVAVMVLASASPPIPYSVGTEETAVPADQWIDNRHTEPLLIRFDNGSRFELLQSTAAKVVSSDEEQVTVHLKHGRLLADIKGNGHTGWEVTAGPYRVSVMGTRFTVDWDDAVEALEVNVTQGRVLVEEKGKGKGKIKIELEKGKRLHAERRTGRIVVGNNRETAVPAEPSREPPSIAPSVAAKSSEPLETVPGPHAVADSRFRDNDVTPARSTSPGREVGLPEWKQRMAAKDWAGAAATCDARALADMAEEADLDALWQTANAFRHERRVSEANALFRSLRRRFAKSSRARTAAFLMGKMALTVSHDPVRARDWFTTYLREAPKGALREDAFGHLMRICRDQGDTASAKRFAAQYLNQYNGGVYHERATSILND